MGQEQGMVSGRTLGLLPRLSGELRMIRRELRAYDRVSYVGSRGRNHGKTLQFSAGRPLTGDTAVRVASVSIPSSQALDRTRCATSQCKGQSQMQLIEDNLT